MGIEYNMKKKIKIIEEKQVSNFWSNLFDCILISIVMGCIGGIIISGILAFVLHITKISTNIFFGLVVGIAWVISGILFALVNREYTTKTKEKKVIIEEIKQKKKRK